MHAAAKPVTKKCKSSSLKQYIAEYPVILC